jgi:hypothetical protein
LESVKQEKLGLVHEAAHLRAEVARLREEVE